MAFEPERTGREARIDAGRIPPCGFVAVTMDLAVMAPAEWHREFVAHLAAERAALGKAEVMRIRRLTAANQARLLGDVSDVLAVTDAARFGQRQHTLVDGFEVALLRGSLLRTAAV